MSEPADSSEPFSPRSGWAHKFRYAFRGLAQGIGGQSSFKFHLPVAVVVVAAGCYLRVSVVELCILLLCIALVLSLELINSGLEFLAGEVTQGFSKRIEAALNIGAAAVLMASGFAVVIGLLILLPKIYAEWFAAAT